MTWHPTTNRIPTGLLKPEEQAALKSWPHGWECFASSCGWSSRDNPMWSAHLVYRGKPAPVVKSVWFNRHHDGMSGPFTTRKSADFCAYTTRKSADFCAYSNRVDVLRIDTCNGVSTAHLEGLE